MAINSNQGPARIASHCGHYPGFSDRSPQVSTRRRVSAAPWRMPAALDDGRRHHLALDDNGRRGIGAAAIYRPTLRPGRSATRSRRPGWPAALDTVKRIAGGRCDQRAPAIEQRRPRLC